MVTVEDEGGNMHRVLTIVTDIDNRTRGHTGLLESLHKRLAEPVERIAENTKTMADTLIEFKGDNKELTGLVSGKRQVPMTIFLIVVLVLCIAWLLDRATRGLHLRASPTGGIEFNYEELKHP